MDGECSDAQPAPWRAGWASSIELHSAARGPLITKRPAACSRESAAAEASVGSLSWDETLMAIPSRNAMTPIRVIFVEDSLIEVELGATCLRDAGYQPEIRIAQDRRSLLSLLMTFEPHLVVSDLHLSRFTALEAFELVQANAPNVPFILRTSDIPRYSVRQALGRCVRHIDKDDDCGFAAVVGALVSRCTG